MARAWEQNFYKLNVFYKENIYLFQGISSLLGTSNVDFLVYLHH